MSIISMLAPAAEQLHPSFASTSSLVACASSYIPILLGKAAPKARIHQRSEQE
jgi:hypothetical protein